MGGALVCSSHTNLPSPPFLSQPRSYGFMMAVFVILTIVVSCVTVVSTYFLLNSEDHRWAWHAFLSGASAAVYVFLYSVYYFLFRTECVRYCPLTRRLQ